MIMIIMTITIIQYTPQIVTEEVASPLPFNPSRPITTCFKARLSKDDPCNSEDLPTLNTQLGNARERFRFKR